MAVCTKRLQRMGVTIGNEAQFQKLQDVYVSKAGVAMSSAGRKAQRDGTFNLQPEVMDHRCF
jgi:hypothetical protein